MTQSKHRKQKGYDRLEVTRIRGLGNHEVPTTWYRKLCECEWGSRLEISVLGPRNL